MQFDVIYAYGAKLPLIPKQHTCCGFSLLRESERNVTSWRWGRVSAGGGGRVPLFQPGGYQMGRLGGLQHAHNILASSLLVCALLLTVQRTLCTVGQFCSPTKPCRRPSARAKEQTSPCRGYSVHSTQLPGRAKFFSHGNEFNQFYDTIY